MDLINNLSDNFNISEREMEEAARIHLQLAKYLHTVNLMRWYG